MMGLSSFSDTWRYVQSAKVATLRSDHVKITDDFKFRGFEQWLAGQR